MARFVALLLLLAGCDGPGEISAGRGFIIERRSEESSLAVDETSVPRVDVCAADQAIVREVNGWSCGGVPEESLSGQDRARFTAEAAGLAAQVAATSSRAAALRERLLVLEGLLVAARGIFDRQRVGHPLSTAAIACFPAPEPWEDGQIYIEEHVVRLQGTDKLELFCAFSRPSADSAWRVERWDYLDPGDIFGSDVLKGQLLNFRVGASDTISSSWTSAEVGGAGQISFPTLISQLPDPAVGYPYHRLEYFTPAGGSELGFVGVSAQPLPYAPPELQNVGGLLYIDFGAPKETADNGRRWHDDDVFFSGAGLVRENDGSSVDRSLLVPGDRDFHEAVLRSERYCNCDLRVSIGAPNGLYLAQLYFFDRATGLVTRRDEQAVATEQRIDFVVEYSGTVEATLSAMLVGRLE